MKKSLALLTLMTAAVLASAAPVSRTAFADQTLYDDDCNGSLDRLFEANDGFLRTGFSCGGPSSGAGWVSLVHFSLTGLSSDVSNASFTFRDAGSTVPGTIGVYAYSASPLISLIDYMALQRTGQFELAGIATIVPRDRGIGSYTDITVDVTDAIRSLQDRRASNAGFLLMSTGANGVAGGGGGASDICSRESGGMPSYVAYCGLDGAPRLTLEFQNRLPEPSTLMLALGALAVAARTHRRR